MNEWYKQTAQQVVQELETDIEHGLSQDVVARRREQYGPNELTERGGPNPWRILLSQFTETMVIILLIAAAISAFLGEYTDAVVILAIVVLNALLGFRQEYQAEQAMEALKKLAVPSVRVRRDGKVSEIPARELVPGDMVLLEAGSRIPADMRLVESANLRVQESALTGESEPVSKKAEFTSDSDQPLAERRNMVYMGTNVTYGRGTAVVAEIGMKTELGDIAEMMQSTVQEPTPLQKRLDQLGKGLAVAAFVLVVIVFLLGIFQGQPLQETFTAAIALAVAAVPEGLPAVVTIALALGARRMLRRRALIRKLPAVETLGSVTVICSDKTGTLTENRMTVTVIDVAEHRLDLTEDQPRLGMRSKTAPCQDVEPNEEQKDALRAQPALTLLLAGGALANDAVLECEEGKPDVFHVVGDPTEGALVVAAARIGLRKGALEKIFPRVMEVPFESERKRMSTVHKMPVDEQDIPPAFRAIWNWSGWAGEVEHVVFTKGAMDSLLEVSDQVWVEDRTEPMTDAWCERIEVSNKLLAENGMRVLGVAVRALDVLPNEASPENLETGLTFVGLVGMIDPSRPEVEAAVEEAKEAGIRPIMITGDHPLTAGFIARELGITTDGEVITGQELERMSVEELADVVERASVYARVSPEHKLRIVEALQSKGEITAMTGDGVNDAPALRTADIGVAMGITGTDVSKEAADMVLLDDNFATIVAAVEEGRVIYDNIRKFIKYTLSSNAGEIWIMLIAPFLGMPLALLPLQILWINLVTDGLPGLALSVEKGESNTMRRPPYPPKENIFARGVGVDILWVGFLMGVISLGIGWWYWRMGDPAWQTMIFSTITLSEMSYVMAIRSRRDSVFTIGLFSNRPLVGAVVLTTLLQLAVIYVPFLQSIFDTRPLELDKLLIVAVLSTSLFWLVEIRKWFLRRSPESE